MTAGRADATARPRPCMLHPAAVKPRVRSLMRLLALHGGDAVHRERVIECLWPDEGDLRTGLKNLQVAISSLRQLVEPGVGR